MGLLSNIRSYLTPVQKVAEGQPRPGPWYLPISGGWLSADAGAYMNWWQLGYDVASGSRSSMVEACVSAYSQTVAMCPGDHWVTQENGGRDRVTTSALSRFLRVPNSYQSISDFMLNAVRSLYSDGNTYGLALRNNRYEVQSIHLMDPKKCQPLIAESGELFYSLGGNEVIQRLLTSTTMIVPARDVWHMRLSTSSYSPLKGESPIVSAARDIAAGDAMANQQFKYFMNMARPSAVLQTELELDKPQVDALRQRWDEQTRGMNQGGTPILTSGLKMQPVGNTNEDSQLAELMKMSDQRIALAFGVPLQILGVGEGSTGSTEAYMRFWLSRSLGFCLNHIEESLGRMFELDGYPDEYLEFSTDALLRSAMKDRVEAFARGTLGGIYSPNEARAEFGLPAVEYGNEPRVQQQVVPLSAASGIPAAPGPEAPPSMPAAPAPKQIPPPAAQPATKDIEDASLRIRDAVRTKYRSSHARENHLS